MPTRFSTRGVLPPLVPARVHDRDRGRRRHPGEVPPGVEALGDQPRRPRWSPARAAPRAVYAHVPWTTETRWVAVAFPPGLRTARTAPDPLMDLTQLPRTSTRLVEDAKGGPDLPALPGHRDPQQVTVAAREGHEGRPEVRDDIPEGRGGAGEANRSRPSGRREIERARASCARSTTPSPSLPPWRATCGTAGPTAHERALPSTRRSHLNLAAVVREVLTDAGLVVTLSEPMLETWRRSRRWRVWPHGVAAAAGRCALTASTLPQLDFKLLFTVDPLMTRGQGGAGRALRLDGRGGGLAGHAHRRDQEGALPDGRQLRRAGGQGDDDLHRQHPPRQMGRLPGHRAAHAARSGAARGGLPPLEGRAVERPEAGPAQQQRGGAGEGSACRPTSSRDAGYVPRSGDGGPASSPSRSTTCGASQDQPPGPGASPGPDGDTPPGLDPAAVRLAALPEDRRRPRQGVAGSPKGIESRSSRRTRGPPPSPSAIPSRSRSHPTSPRSGWPGPGWHRASVSRLTSASARCAG